MKFGNAPSVETPKADMICGLKVTCVASATRWDRIAGDVRPRNMCQSKQMRTGIAQVIGVTIVTTATGIRTGETGTLTNPMQGRD